MLQQQAYIISAFLMVFDALCVIIAGYGAFYINNYLLYGRFSMDSNVLVILVMLVMFLNNYMMGRYHLYNDKKPLSYLYLLWPIFKVIVVDFVILSTGIVLFKQINYSRAFLFLFAVLAFVLIVIQRILFQVYINRVSQNSFNVRKILVVGNVERAKIVSDLLEIQLSWGHEVIGRLKIQGENSDAQDSLGSIEDLSVILRDSEIDEVVFALNGDRSFDLSNYLHICKKMGVSVRILPSLWKPGNQALAVDRCQNVPFLTIEVDNFYATGLLYKRILDLAGGLFGTLCFFIIYPFVGVAIKLDSPGPVIFKQRRVGRHGRIFNLHKFRSMYQDAEQRKQELLEKNEMKGAMFKLKNDPRITRVGRWLRKTSLDEFPQFLNVLKGEMSLVGTRPPMPEEVETYLPRHLRRMSAKPGITGLWQISGRNQIADFDKVVELDCKYLHHWRFSDDLKILFKTVLVVLKRKGAI
ncbi:MAG: sugar transferase [Deltaproteobacteria bacterium]|nr:sugar transferase [Deltaproteobacteria bacterium]